MAANDDKDSQSTFTLEQATKMFNFWSEVLKLPTIGPTYAFSKDLNTYANDLINLGKIMSEMKIRMDEYWSLVNAAYIKASRETAERSPKQFVSKDDLESYRKGAIDAFEDAFTGLFSSPEFSEVYGRLFSAQLDMTKALQSIAEKNMKALNLPTRSEVDEMLRDIHELKRSVRELKKSIGRMDNEQTRVTT